MALLLQDEKSLNKDHSPIKARPIIALEYMTRDGPNARVGFHTLLLATEEDVFTKLGKARVTPDFGATA